jgi:hypothetical protein
MRKIKVSATDTGCLILEKKGEETYQCVGVINGGRECLSLNLGRWFVRREQPDGKIIYHAQNIDKKGRLMTVALSPVEDIDLDEIVTV